MNRLNRKQEKQNWPLTTKNDNDNERDRDHGHSKLEREREREKEINVSYVCEWKRRTNGWMRRGEDRDREKLLNEREKKKRLEKKRKEKNLV